jgi:hypothetical protein
MRRQRDVVAVGTLSNGIDRHGRKVRPRDRWRLVGDFHLPFAHGSAMIRRDAFERVGGYREGIMARDADLFVRLGEHGRIVVLPEALYTYRFNAGSMTLAYSLDEASRSIDELLRSLAARRAGRREQDLSEAPSGEPVPWKSVIAALRLQGALRLWAGGSPRVLDDLLEIGFRLDRTWLQTLVWAAWGEASPGTLRGFLRALVRARDKLAGLWIKDGRTYEWRSG